MVRSKEVDRCYNGCWNGDLQMIQKIPVCMALPKCTKSHIAFQKLFSSDTPYPSLLWYRQIKTISLALEDTTNLFAALHIHCVNIQVAIAVVCKLPKLLLKLCSRKSVTVTNVSIKDSGDTVRRHYTFRQELPHIGIQPVEAVSLSSSKNLTSLVQLYIAHGIFEGTLASTQHTSHTHACMHTHARAHTHIDTQTHTYARTRTRARTHTQTHTHTPNTTHARARTHTFTHTHTHTHMISIGNMQCIAFSFKMEKVWISSIEYAYQINIVYWHSVVKIEVPPLWKAGHRTQVLFRALILHCLLLFHVCLPAKKNIIKNIDNTELSVLSVLSKIWDIQ